ncbi:MAG: ZirU family protein, partial [Aeromonadaceae bacterium]
DPDMDAQAPSEYKWSRDGIDMGVTGDSYTLTLADLGTQITAGVIPQTDATTTDPYQGNEVAAAGGSPDGDGSVDVVDPNEVDAVEIVIAATDAALGGNPIVSTELRAKVTTSAGGVGVASDYNYTWQIEDGAGGNYINIPGAVSETYTPSKDDQKRKLRVDVTKK